MTVALTLTYFSADGDPITVHASTDPELIRLFRDAVLDEARRRTRAVESDTAAQAIGRAEEERLRRVLNLLVPGEAA